MLVKVLSCIICRELIDFFKNKKSMRVFLVQSFTFSFKMHFNWHSIGTFSRDETEDTEEDVEKQESSLFAFEASLLPVIGPRCYI